MSTTFAAAPLFAGVPAAARAQLESRMRRVDFVPQTTIVREGAAGDSAFVIISGRVAVRRRDPQSGLEFVLTELGPGEIVGDLALLTGHPRSATVVALDATSCGVLTRADFEAVVQAFPSVGLALMASLAERLERANQHAGVDFVSLQKLKVDPRVLALLPEAVVKQQKVLPIAFANNRLTLAMANPNNIVALDDVRRIIKGVLIEPVAVADDDLKRFLTANPLPAPGAPATAADHTAAAVSAPPDLLQSDLIRELQLADDAQAVEGETKQDLMSASEDAPIIRLTNSILGLAITQGASDIHVEPMEHDVVVRFRVDGVLQVVQRLPKKVQLGLISRVKILAKLDIAEKRLPQDGRISVTMETRPIDFRVSTVPGKWGEKIVMRILDKSNTSLGLDKLITHPPTLALVRSMIEEPYGIVYVTGPTGSGKTTTLYSALAEINDPGVNISTAEDPIEYDLPGVTQIQTKADIGLTFAAVLRAFLRQDPDVLLVGETRDKETARTAVEAALTGHLVFTTLHTNSAAAAFTRLREMDIEPFLVTSSTIGVVAQRLARRLCQECREPYAADAAVASYFGLAEGTTLYRGRGCASCSNRGVRGRIGIYEVLRMTPALRALVAGNSTADDIHAAVASGMIDLKRYAAILLQEGLTTVEEVTSVVAVDV